MIYWASSYVSGNVLGAEVKHWATSDTDPVFMRLPTVNEAAISHPRTVWVTRGSRRKDIICRREGRQLGTAEGWKGKNSSTFKRNLPDKKRKEIFIGCETLGGRKILFWGRFLQDLLYKPLCYPLEAILHWRTTFFSQACSCIYFSSEWLIATSYTCCVVFVQICSHVTI